MNNDKKKDIEVFASKILDKGLAVPAIFLFESTKYISFIAGQTLIFFGPILTLFVNDKKYYKFVKLLEDKKNIETLITTIEEKHFESKNIK
jgi:hypothetical protein|tara:strand:- start:434 stop:706 length:273 start_codon:yes stop_codon:yes gene_type:complete